MKYRGKRIYDFITVKIHCNRGQARSINKAAKELFIAQPSLTAAIKELEQELGITIFSRTNKGVIVSTEGEEFLAMPVR